MLAGIKNLLFRNGTSKSRAKSRLHFVLVQDRTGLTAEQMSKFKGELVSVIGKYFVIDEQGFDVAYQRDEGSTTLLINSPVVVKRQEALKGMVGAKSSDSKSKKAAAL